MPLEEVRELCHEVLMWMIPGLVEHDLDLFGSAVNRVQHLVVRSLPGAMVQAGAVGAGLSLFGPTVYAIGDSGMEDDGWYVYVPVFIVTPECALFDARA